MRVRLGVTFHHVFYAPYLVALQLGHFAQEGLQLESQVYGDGARLSADLHAGAVDCGLGGVMRAMIDFDRGEVDIPIHFARLNDGDGFFLIGRALPFNLSNLLDARLALFSEAPTPWFVLRGQLKQRDLDPDRVQTLQGLAAIDAAEAFRRGDADFLQTSGLIAETLLAEGAGIVVAEMASVAGSIPYSSYSARRPFLEREPDAIQAFTRAHIRALDWINSVDGAHIWEVIRPAFADSDQAAQQRAVERYRRLGVWGADATLPRDGYERLGEYLRLGGLLRRVAPYERLVDDSAARELTSHR